MTDKQVDPVTVATVWHALQTSCREMRDIIRRTAQNYLIGQARDVSVGIWAANGDTIAVPEGLPVQFLGSRFAVQSIIEIFKDNLNPGDIILSNDPYHGGHNCHLPDWGFFRPIFHNGELAFFAMARAHMQDTGGSFPGGYFPDGYDIHAEGICIPPIKVWDRGVERTDVMELIWNNVRWPRGVRLDNYALIAATQRAEERCVALMDKYGRETVNACVSEMFRRSETAIREEIRNIPDGTYHAEAGTDDDGSVLDEPVWIKVDLTVKGDELTIDFSECPEQRKGFVNTVYATTYGNAIAAALLFFDPALADFHNEGSMRPISVITRKGSVVDCNYPATVGGSPVSIGCQVMEAVMEAMSNAVPHRAMAAWGKHRGEYAFAVDPRTGERYVRTLFDYDGGCGAVYGYDGYQAVSTLTTLGALIRGTVEEHETRLPWKVLKWEFMPDHSGAGRWRGGSGMEWEAVNLGSDGQMASGSSDGDEIQGYGIHGGLPSPKSRTWLRRGDELIRVKPHRLVPFRHGDVLVKHSAGGGGVGSPFDRDPEAVRRDLRDELISAEAAREIYGVVIDADTLEIDPQATAALRARRKLFDEQAGKVA